MSPHPSQAAPVDPHPDETDGPGPSRVTPKRRILALTAVIVAATAALAWILPGATEVGKTHPLVLVGLTSAFALAEKLIFHIEARDDALSYSPSEFGLALGILFVSPIELVAVRVLGALIGMLIWRRPPAFKVAFNLAHFALESMLAVVLFRAMTAISTDLLVRWLSLLLALTTALVVGGTLVAIAIAQFEGDLRSRIEREIRGAHVFHFAPAVVATLIAISVMVEPRLGLLAATPAPVIWFMIRSHGSLVNRHLDITTVHEFSTTVGDATDLSEIAQAAIESIAEGTSANSVALRLWDVDGAPVDALIGSHIDMSKLPRSASDPALADLASRRTTERIGPLSPATPHVTAMRKSGVIHGLVAPVADDRGLLGIVVVANDAETDAAFDNDGLYRAVAMAQQLGILVRKARLRTQIEYEAGHDRLTGLPNRRRFEALVNSLLDSGERQAVLLIDLDRFKEVNDSFGHQAGDKVLIEVASRIQAACDTTATAARFGGDEFAVIAPGCRGSEATNLAEQIRHAIEAPIDIGQAIVTVGSSIGVALAPDHAADANLLLHRSDLAMYAAKAMGGRTTVYDEEFNTSGAARLTLLTDLRKLLDDESLQVYFQPQLDLQTGKVVGAEALARWQHPDLGSVAPDVFIRLAEQSGLIDELTRQVLVRATAAAAEWHRRGWDFSVSVNISPQSLLDERLETLVADALATSGLAPAQLVLEITETTIMGDASRTHRILHSLARLGVRLSVDDFGTGYSSLTNLRHFPVAELKIDRSFILDLMSDSTNDVIVRSTIELGHNLGLTIVAEGIEDNDVRNRLTELGCDLAQGFGLCPPMPQDAFLFWAENNPTVGPPIAQDLFPKLLLDACAEISRVD